MPITTETTPLFTHAFFVPLGTAFTVPGAGTASATAKPGAADASWAAGSLGDIEEWKPDPQAETFDKYAGRPGTLVLVDKVTLKKELNLSWKTQDVTPLLHQLLFGTLALTGASNQANPLEGDPIVKGWLKTVSYAGANRRVTSDYWVAMKVKSADPWSGKNIVQVEFEAAVIHSALNTTTFE